MIGPRYSDTDETISIGDAVRGDDDYGKVVAICEPRSKMASDYSCDDTGGLLIDFHRTGLTLLPYGLNVKLYKVDRSVDEHESEN